MVACLICSAYKKRVLEKLLLNKSVSCTILHKGTIIIYPFHHKQTLPFLQQISLFLHPAELYRIEMTANKQYSNTSIHDDHLPTCFISTASVNSLPKLRCVYTYTEIMIT